MRIDIVTLFPGMLEAPLAESILGRARARGLVDIRVHDLREHATGRHRVTDEAPFGGGGGMILKPEPLAAAIDALRAAGSAEAPPRVILLGPAGRRFTQAVAGELVRRPHLVLVCGRYEGVDERVSEQLVDEELSIGDYVLTGGEPAALVVADAVTRLLPGVLGDEDAPAHDSFARGLLEHPQYTRPEVFRGAAVPDVLRSGDHGRIARWRTLMSLWRTWQRRPDLLETADLTPEEQKWTDAFRQGGTPADLLD
ncbi:MAG TPA: tRNA (guanosine(37)-N1)-methyltransferase TrmD [Candidatus Dormibacteraeota bacterium]|nr:tRNA (guanosine(37)-N1)-methyltransferase TrmD [Candidatus Dormibacteraeota bacterium]